MIQTALKNWRTTSAGLAVSLTAIVHLVFQIIHGTVTESDVTFCLGNVLAGLGLIAAGDGSASAANHEETKQALTALSQAVKSGDTTQLNKTDLTKTP